MLKKTIRYEDFNGQQVEKTCYFHLSKSELVELEMSREGGLQEYLQRIIASNDGRAIMEEFKKLVLLSYGKRSEDGSGFRKSEGLRDEFFSSQAYDALFMELCTDAEKAAEFVNGIVPANLEKEMAKLTKSTKASDEAQRVRELGTNTGEAKNVFEENSTRVLTRQEAIEMDEAELKEGLISGRFRLE